MEPVRHTPQPDAFSPAVKRCAALKLACALTTFFATCAFYEYATTKTLDSERFKEALGLNLLGFALVIIFVAGRGGK